METMVSKSLEFNTDLWVISVDLKKAFDRVEHAALFQSLRNHGLEQSYCNLLNRIYDGQIGILSEEVSFGIDRGVRQRDVLSPILFNCALENAIAAWKDILTSEGVALDAKGDRLTNIRFADDLLLFGKTMEEVIHMVEQLVLTLRKYGLELNVKKTKMMSTTVQEDDSILIDTRVGFLELLGSKCSHKYLGRNWCGNLRRRGETALNHRLACGWMKFREHQASLCNKHISLRSRLRLFTSTVTPAVLYGLNTTPLTERMIEKLNITQRKMLRKIIGWVIITTDSYEQNGHRMKERMERALLIFPLKPWSAELQKGKQALMARIQSQETSPSVRKIWDWKPLQCSARNAQAPFRGVGRPRVRWNDPLT